MKVLIILFISMCVSSAWAERFQAKIHQIEISSTRNRPHLIKFDNGRVAFLKKEDVATLRAMKLGRNSADVLELEVDEDYDVLSVTTIENGQGLQSLETPTEMSSSMLAFNPSVLSSLTGAKTVFGRMKTGWQYDSQCYNRAHVWAYEEFKRSGLKTMKLFLFFTNRYIRNYRYKWWFHVSPQTLVRENGVVKRRVLDKRYTSGPLYVKTWTDRFIATRRSCPIVAKYSQYRNNQESQDCYLMSVSQYYWQPRDIENKERYGTEKTSFIQKEIDWSYWEAF